MIKVITIQDYVSAESIRWQNIGDLTLMDMAYSLYDADQRRLACCQDIQKLHQSLIEQQINCLVQVFRQTSPYLLSFYTNFVICFDHCHRLNQLGSC